MAKKQENQFDLKKVNQKKFFKNLVKQEDFLPLADKDRIAAYKKKFFNNHWNIDIFTFNYTTIIEKIIGEGKNIKIGHHLNDRLNVTLSGGG